MRAACWLPSQPWRFYSKHAHVTCNLNYIPPYDHTRVQVSARLVMSMLRQTPTLNVPILLLSGAPEAAHTKRAMNKALSPWCPHRSTGRLALLDVVCLNNGCERASRYSFRTVLSFHHPINADIHPDSLLLIYRAVNKA